MDVATLVGVNQAAVSNDVSGVFSQAYNAYPGVSFKWYVTWTTSTGLATTALISYEMELLVHCELHQLNAGALLDN